MHIASFQQTLFSIANSLGLNFNKQFRIDGERGDDTESLWKQIANRLQCSGVQCTSTGLQYGSRTIAYDNLTGLTNFFAGWGYTYYPILSYEILQPTQGTASHLQYAYIYLEKTALLQQPSHTQVGVTTLSAVRLGFYAGSDGSNAKEQPTK